MIMMQMCKDNVNAGMRKTGEEWTFEDIKKHQERMIDILMERI